MKEGKQGSKKEGKQGGGRAGGGKPGADFFCQREGRTIRADDYYLRAIRTVRAAVTWHFKTLAKADTARSGSHGLPWPHRRYSESFNCHFRCFPVSRHYKKRHLLQDSESFYCHCGVFLSPAIIKKDIYISGQRKFLLIAIAVFSGLPPL